MQECSQIIKEQNILICSVDIFTVDMGVALLLKAPLREGFVSSIYAIAWRDVRNVDVVGFGSRPNFIVIR